MELPEDELFTLAPADFTKRRNELARTLKAAGDNDAAERVAGLTKPSLAAWALNQVARTKPDEISALTDAHEALRSPRGAAGLREATARRNRAVAGIVEEASRILERGGHGAGPAVVDKMTRTLLATGSDEAAREALVAGRLLKDVAAGGFGELDWSAAAEATPATPEASGRRRAELQAEIGRLTEAAADARSALKTAERRAQGAALEAERAGQEADQARRSADQAAAALERKKAELENL